MTFFNKKEDVLDVQLTQYGKHLLSIGKFRPAYYSFFDDELLYDTDYADISEDRKDAHDRIVSTPMLKTRHVFHGIETELETMNALQEPGGEFYKNLIQNPHKQYALSAPLGNSSLASSYLPAWDYNVYIGEISGSVTFRTGSYGTQRIPVIAMKDIEYYSYPVETIEETRISTEVGDNVNVGKYLLEEQVVSDDTYADSNFTTRVFDDSSAIIVRGEEILLSLEEINVEDMKDNYDIEVFICETDEEGNEYERQLLFDNPCITVDEQNLLVNQDVVPTIDTNILDRDYVEHYFHLLVDEEINRDLLCRALPKSEKERRFPSSYLDCEESLATQVETANLYETNITPSDLEDKCD